ncbi:M3 family metallopeptidase [Caldimonas thermodepolymerans]|jgi:oligopeptidase A|uniref:oligopeptidase A n=1 Tax=Caldimonas thermodepolymerans TaxID=215580 RepID=A0A2S5T0H4_9BURK|nr:M3 family metallopeptidase [Caldimonas thermodepolymerans]PPE68419.1 oligopeptidase A [Caldimonas thermodepolymerans]QPC32956.1 M3 family metallopeptidase [Caldimonas thermodepolymerans]RDI03738.1 oligopeptidase A [Caldimonas thermodepolymerans]TCP09706.1 oligopeptidase A [Caldimonas thermodepolymerans]UZG45824.1 M3 family metallopeptidase [Caldimonas thermodepolymerans]
MTTPTVTNPLLDFSALPRFAEVRPEHVGPAIDQLLAAADAALEQVVSDAVPVDHDAIAAVLDVATERLGRAWGMVSHLNAVADSPELRAVYNENLPKVTQFYTRLGADERLYAKYKALAARPDAPQQPPARRQALSNAIRNFVLSGAELQGAAKERFAQIQERQAELAQKFSEHVLDATDSFAYYASEEELAGVPEDTRAAARAAAEREGKDGYKITLQFPSYYPVMQYGSHRPLREKLYRAYATRASELGDPKFDNSWIMAELLALRQEEARLLGHRNYAEVSLVPKMAESPEQVMAFLRDLARRARPYAEKDLAELREFARTELGLEELQAWDMAYASEKLKEKRYAFSDQEVKQYFTEPKVLEGLFRIVETLFEVQIRPDTAPVWHPSVRFFRIERGGQLVGQFYLDPYARAGKRSGAWMDDVRSRWARPDGGLQTPVAHLVCNFAEGVGGKPALLTHDEVTTLFHEFGHGLHHLLTQVDEIGVAGISGVEWDAVELPSQFMENFCWEWDVLRHMTAHVDTGKPLPRELYDKMVAARNFQSGMQMLRQIEFALIDMRLHAEPGSEARIQEVVDEVRHEVAVVIPPAFNRMQHSFSHIFAGGYAAGYYSYKWAEVLSADAYSAFEEAGVLNVETGRRYRREILEAGGSRPADESFRAFRGREPRIDALLRHSGMA